MTLHATRRYSKDNDDGDDIKQSDMKNFCLHSIFQALLNFMVYLNMMDIETMTILFK